MTLVGTLFFRAVDIPSLGLNQSQMELLDTSDTNSNEDDEQSLPPLAQSMGSRGPSPFVRTPEPHVPEPVFAHPGTPSPPGLGQDGVQSDSAQGQAALSKVPLIQTRIGGGGISATGERRQSEKRNPPPPIFLRNPGHSLFTVPVGS